VLRPVEAILVTHSHLDHVGGFIQKTTMDAFLATEGRPPLRVLGLPATVEALRAHAFAPPLWADFTRIPPRRPAVALVPLAPGTLRTAGGFSVMAIPLHHEVESAGYFVFNGSDAYLHLGDTGQTEAVWRAARPLLAHGKLRAVAIEVSWPAGREELAVRTGHLTTRSLLLELNKLARAWDGPLPPATTMDRGRALDLAARLAPRLDGVTIIALHVKALDHDQTVAELAEYRHIGLRIVVPVQAALYRF
jgi:cAMP phosphodiesterase